MNVRMAWQRAATALHKIQQCTILICLRVMNVLRFSVNTNEVSRARMIMIFLSSDTHGTLRPTRMNSHSLRASSATCNYKLFKILRDFSVYSFLSC